jgi:hypothetical protein
MRTRCMRMTSKAIQRFVISQALAKGDGHLRMGLAAPGDKFRERNRHPSLPSWNFMIFADG